MKGGEREEEENDQAMTSLPFLPAKPNFSLEDTGL
jgi:hypothetical protein